MQRITVFLMFCGVFFLSCAPTPEYDIVILNGTVIDGSGQPGYPADIGIKGEQIAFIGDLEVGDGVRAMDATGLVVSPGFIDMMGQSEYRLLLDGRSQSKAHQGITTEVTGEGGSIAPLAGPALASFRERTAPDSLDVVWTTLEGYFEALNQKGISINIATFVGATQVRACVIGYDDRPPTEDELARMRQLVTEAMEDGAWGLSSSLVYPPAFYASTEELIALAQIASSHGGIYATHMRSESNNLFEALEEAIRIGREAEIPVEIFHLKAAGKTNWDKVDEVLKRIEDVRSEGLDIMADVYPYTAGSTGLASTMPPWVQDGGREDFYKRLQDPAIRRRLQREMTTLDGDWENFYIGSDRIMITDMPLKDYGHYEGKYLRDLARERNEDPMETIFNLHVLTEGFRIDAVYFMMAEENKRKIMQKPWVSFCCDSGARATEGRLNDGSPHPRAYGTFPRILGKYVREEKLLTVEEAIRKMTALPASRMGFKDRGRIETGLAADIVCFNPDTVIDKATYEDPHQYPEGIDYVLVNGTVVIDQGQHTGARSGKPLLGPARIP
jgi:N-acyl-D-amino-acid deacylase